MGLNTTIGGTILITMRDARLRLNLSQAELAVKAIVSYQTVSRAEAGKPVSKASALRICHALGIVDLEEVVGINLVYRAKARKETGLQDSQQ